MSYTLQAKSFMVFLFLSLPLFSLALGGCSFAQVDLGGGKKKDGPVDPVVLVYTYDKDGKPLTTGTIVKNQKITIEVLDKATGQSYHKEIDAGGWKVIAPVSREPSEMPQNK